MAARRAGRTDPIQIVARRGFLMLFCSAWVSGVLFLSSGQPASAGMGGTGDPSASALGTEAIAEEDIPADEPLGYAVYALRRGDTLSALAEQFNITLDTIVSVNGISNARSLKTGQLLKIPNRSGIMYLAKAGDTVDAVATANDISADSIIEANGLFSRALEDGRPYFLPEARLSSFTLREISGDLFRWPVRGWVTSWFGYRNDPFTGVRTYHSALDIACAYGTPIGAGMEGTVVETGYSPIFGNFVTLSHHSGYRSFYGHLSKVGVKEGQWVGTGQYIGNIGSTGYSTGPHVHFSITKNGRPINPSVVMH